MAHYASEYDKVPAPAPLSDWGSNGDSGSCSDSDSDLPSLVDPDDDYAAALAAGFALRSGIKDKMILDTGANAVHVFNDLSVMTDVRPAPKDFKITFGGNVGTPELMGTVVILSDAGCRLALTDVAYWKDCPSNLVAFNRTWRAGFKSVAPNDGTERWIFSRGGLTAFTCTLGPTDFWELDAQVQRSPQPPVSGLVAGASKQVPVTAQMVHRCFAHQGSDGALARALDGDMLEGAPPISGADLKAAAAAGRCIPCITGKHTRLPFKTSKTSASRPAQVIHSDIQGPLPESKDGYRYCISYLDDASDQAIFDLMRHCLAGGGSRRLCVTGLWLSVVAR